MEKSTLVLFTLHYPYSKVSETFLDPELRILANRFEKIYIVPWKKEIEEMVILPANVEVVNILLPIELNKNYFRQYLKHFRQLIFLLKIYTYAIWKDKPALPYLSSAYFLYNLINAFERYLILKKFINERKLNRAVFYDYWFENSTLSLAMLKNRGIIDELFTRGHGFDVFDDRWTCGALPFRSYKLKHCTRHFAISAYNKAYMQKKVNGELRDRIELAYLGVPVNALIKPLKEKVSRNQYTIVSCANLFDFKQVHFIPKLLNLIDLPIKWYHFGDGPMQSELLDNAEALNDHVQFNFMGHIDHDELMRFYKTEQVDLHLSLSLKEGLPVSMMEALSFGIPLAGYRVYGIPEIICEKCGVLFDLNEDFDVMAKRIKEFLTKEEVDTDYLIEMFNQKFNATNNYNALADRLIET